MSLIPQAVIDLAEDEATKKSRRHYTATEITDAVEEVRLFNGHRIIEISAKRDIPHGTLTRWWEHFKKHKKPPTPAKRGRRKACVRWHELERRDRSSARK